jgi:hypothetical protein
MYILGPNDFLGSPRTLSAYVRIGELAVLPLPALARRTLQSPSHTIGFPSASSGHGLPCMSMGFSSFWSTACCHCTGTCVVDSHVSSLCNQVGSAKSHRVLLDKAPLHRLPEVFLASDLRQHNDQMTTISQPHTRLERLLELAAGLLELGSRERQARVLVLAVLRQLLRVGAHLLRNTKSVESAMPHHICAAAGVPSAPQPGPCAVPREESCAPCCSGPRAPRNLRSTRERCQHMIQLRSWTPRGRNMRVREGKTRTRARPCSRGHVVEDLAAPCRSRAAVQAQCTRLSASLHQQLQRRGRPCRCRSTLCGHGEGRHS